MKYPRTLHLPSSPGATKDDERHSSLDSFVGRDHWKDQEVIRNTLRV